MKIIYTILLTLLLGISAAAADVYLDGNDINIDTTLIESTSIVPMRDFFEHLGFCVTWNGEKRCANASKDGLSLSFYVDSNIMSKNGRDNTMPQNTQLIHGVTYVPIRAAAESASLSVAWNGEADRIILSDGIYDENDLYWLSKIISAEACGESMDGKISVGNVVLNRTADKDFPSTVYDVIFDVQYSVQFTPVENGSIYNDPTPESIEAAKLALDRYSVVGDCLYFVNPTLSPDSWASHNRFFYKKIGNHSFYR